MKKQSNAFGAYVAWARRQGGLSLRDLAPKIGVSHVFLFLVEKGQARLARSRWGRLCRQLPGLVPMELERAAVEDLLRRNGFGDWRAVKMPPP